MLSTRWTHLKLYHLENQSIIERRWLQEISIIEILSHQILTQSIWLYSVINVEKRKKFYNYFDVGNN